MPTHGQAGVHGSTMDWHSRMLIISQDSVGWGLVLEKHFHWTSS